MHTLAYLVDQGLVLALHCPACHRGGGWLDPRDHVETLGRDYPIDRLLARYRCTACGHRGAECRVHARVNVEQAEALKRDTMARIERAKGEEP